MGRILLLMLTAGFMMMATPLFSGSDVSKTMVQPMSNAENDTDGGLLKNYASYNRWANERLVEWIAGASEEQFYREVESSFNTLEKTLLHLWNAEYGWLNTVRGENWGTPPGADFDGTAEELFEGFIATSKDFEEYVLGMDSDQFQEDRMLGRNGSPTSLKGIILHVFNHATYHRGQLITMGRQVGLKDPPRTDYIYYIRK
jgi:uncharacterized damage-inducible protein DinB